MTSDRGPVFCCYAREDSDAVLRMAKDLKGAGASVWMDQMDIQPGQRWDREIEQALKRCFAAIVFLSPAAVNSENVMDEAYFALDKQKRVIPVLLQECEVPYRLARLQCVDSRVDYDSTLRLLSAALEVAGPPDLEAIAKAFHQGLTRPLVIKPPIKLRHGGKRE